MNEEPHLIKRSKWRVALTAITFIALAILVYGVRKDIGSVLENLRKVNILYLLLLIPVEALNYHVYARLYVSLFKILDKNVSYKDMFKVNLELNFVNHILPSGGVSGISYFNVRMRAFGVSGPKSTLAQLMKLLLLYISFQPLLILGIFLLAARGHVNNLIMVVASSIITLLVVGTFAFIYMIENRSRINTFLTVITKILNWLIHLVRPRKPETINIKGAQIAFNELHDNYKLFKERWRDLKMPFIYMLLANITEVAAVYVVYIAFGRLVNVGAVILAYAVANFAGLISVLPAGIGVYEGLMTAVLAATGISAGLSIPVTIMYRVLNMTIQLTPGYYFYQKALKSGLSNKI